MSFNCFFFDGLFAIDDGFGVILRLLANLLGIKWQVYCQGVPMKQEFGTLN